MNQETIKNQDVRERLNKLIEDKGTGIPHISKKTNLPDYLIRKFKNGRKDKLWPESLERLDSFLKNENY